MKRIVLSLAMVCVAVTMACAQTVQTVESFTIRGGGDQEIPVKVYVPKGEGPFPAMVVMHHCAGIRSVTVEWTQRLVEWGYVVAVPDSFTPRGYPKGVCGDGSKVGYVTRATDAYAALHLLEQRKDVIAAHIGVMGHSHGGMTTLATASNAIAKTAQSRAGATETFHAAVAFYPWCGDDTTAFTYGNGPTYMTRVPLLMLVGAMDDWTPAAACEDLAKASIRGNQPVQITVYPDARHSFDGVAPVIKVAEARKGKGATIGGNPAARAASIVATRAFLADHLGGSRAQ
ncbi:MAG TPA: dienelactone hydrolase family protein [bacterium]